MVCLTPPPASEFPSRQAGVRPLPLAVRRAERVAAPPARRPRAPSTTPMIATASSSDEEPLVVGAPTAAVVVDVVAAGGAAEDGAAARLSVGAGWSGCWPCGPGSWIQRTMLPSE